MSTVWGAFLGLVDDYLNAGAPFGRLESLSGKLSPRLFLSFALLGLFPLISGRLLDAVKRRTAL